MFCFVRFGKIFVLLREGFQMYQLENRSADRFAQRGKLNQLSHPLEFDPSLASQQTMSLPLTPPSSQ